MPRAPAAPDVTVRLDLGLKVSHLEIPDRTISPNRQAWCCRDLGLWEEFPWIKVGGRERKGAGSSPGSSPKLEVSPPHFSTKDLKGRVS